MANDDVADGPEVQDLLRKINAGVDYFQNHADEAVRYISTELDYEEADAREWLGTVRFPEDVAGVERGTIEKTVEVLRKAGVIGGDQEVRVQDMVLERNLR